MSAIEIDASPKQISRLRNGHTVRIKQAMKGMGIKLIVHPSKFDPISRSFAKGSAFQIQLTPEEIMANKMATDSGEIAGEGIFKPKQAMLGAAGDVRKKAATTGGKLRIGKAFKKVGSAFESAGDKTVSGLATGEEAVRTSPVGSAVVKTVLPMVAEEGAKAGVTYMTGSPLLGKVAGKAGASGTKAGLSEAGYGLYAGRHSGGKIRIGKAFNKVGSAFKSGEEAVRTSPVGRTIVKTVLPIVAEEGAKAGVTYMTGNPVLGKIAGKAGSSATKAGLEQAGYGLYAGHGGRGLYAGGHGVGGAMLGPRSRMPEVSSIGIGGNLLKQADAAVHTALRSDPFSANFHMNTQLPPHLQRGGIAFH